MRYFYIFLSVAAITIINMIVPNATYAQISDNYPVTHFKNTPAELMLSQRMGRYTARRVTGKLRMRRVNRT